MKILNWRLFLEADEFETNIESNNDAEQIIDGNEKINKESLNSISRELSIFKTKKSVMESIFKDIEKQDSEIDSELQSKVYDNQKDDKERNKYLRELESIYRLKRRSDKIKLQIEIDNGRKSDIQKQINDLSDRFNEVNDVAQKSKISERIKKSRDYLNTLTQSINTNRSEYAKIDKNYNDKINGFESMMKSEEVKIKNLSQK